MSMFSFALVISLLCWGALAWFDRQRRKAANVNSPSEHYGGLRHYGIYLLSKRERSTAILIGGIAFAAITHLFYSNLIVSAVACLAGFSFPKWYADMLCKRRLQSLRVQFKQTLQSLSSSLGAGKSIEQAFADTVQDMRMLYPEGSALMIEELEIVLRKISNGGTVEAALLDFSRRSGLSDALYFADVFAVCKRTGGNIIEIVRRTTSIIGDKMEIEQDITVLLAQKKFEARVLLASPIIIIGILKLTAMDYMRPLYAGDGRITMTAALILLGVCMWLTRRMMMIRL